MMQNCHLIKGADMKEKEIIYHIFLDLWDISKRYLLIPLDDFLWERLVEELEEKSQKYKQYGDATWNLYRGIASEIQKYKEQKQKQTEGSDTK